MRTPCQAPSVDSVSPLLRREAWLLSAGIAGVLTAIVGAQAWSLHGVLTEAVQPSRLSVGGWSFFFVVVAANLGAVAMAMSGLVTAGVGSVFLGGVVTLHGFVLLSAGRQWLTGDAFVRGLLVHGTGELLAVLGAMTVGLYPTVRTALCRIRGGRRPRRTYVESVSHCAGPAASIVAVVLVSALYESFVSVGL